MKNLVKTMYKVDFFYLLSEQRLYAYTANKEYAKLFVEQRNMKLFKRVSKKIEKYEWMLFQSENHNMQLIPLPLYDGCNDIEIIGTAEEDDILSDASESIDSNLEYYRRMYVNQSIFNDKYLKVIDDVTNVVMTNETESGDINLTLMVDTFSLFYYLFKKTFTGDCLDNKIPQCK